MLKPIFHDKRAGESYPLAIDFTTRLRDTLAGATIVSGAITGASGLTVSNVTSTATDVRFIMSGGTAGATYDLLVSATLNSGWVIQELVRVAIT